MAVLKQFMRRPAPRAAACWLAARYLRLVQRTGRWELQGTAFPEELLRQRRSFLVAFWHGRLLMGSIAWPYDHPFRMVISEHADGQLIARTVAHLGYGSIPGSTTRGGARVLRGMVRALKDGACVGVTPDGPRGPRMRVAPGIVQAARLSGAPILPMVAAVRPCRLLDTWDRMMLPLPFGRGIVRWGAPLEPPPGADARRIGALLETRLNDMQREIDRELGLDPVEPGAAPAGARA